MNDDSNFGQVKLGYLAHSWFGRPLLLADSVSDSAGVSLEDSIIARLESGCDGFVLRHPSADAADERIAQFEKAVRNFSDKAFVYIILHRPELLDFLRSMSFPKGHMIASHSPKTLADLWRNHPLSNIALMVETEQEFEGLRRCPYTAVTMSESVASHSRFLEIRPGKEIFVRLIFGQHGISNEKQLEKRIRWLIHERVDAIITNRPEPTARALGL